MIGVVAARKRALGNGVVPQCAEVVGKVIAQMIARGEGPEFRAGHEVSATKGGG